MRGTILAVAAVLCCGLLASELPKQGVVTGVVTYVGPVPAPVPVPESQSVRHLVKMDKEGRLAEALVWIEGIESKPTSVKDTPHRHVVDQVDYFFVPNVIAISEGERVVFLNSDGANHGVITESVLPDNTFNIVVPPGGEYSHVFRCSPNSRRKGAPTLVHLRCPIHAAMSGWIAVFPHLYFDVTREDGRFRIENVPPGRYRLRVLHPDTGSTWQEPIEVRGDQTTTVNVVLGGRYDKPRPNSPPAESP